jgi:hypothetical protein
VQQQGQPWLKEQQMNAHETAQCCYAMAYFVLPQYVAAAPEKISDRLSEGRIGAMFYYLMACQLKGLEPGEQDADTMTAFAVRHGQLDDGHDYFVIQYPTPEELDLSDKMNSEDPGEMLDAMRGIVLAPYFSAMVQPKTAGKARYYVLGQSVDGMTTLRSVTPEMNANLGRGCEPRLDAFLELLREGISQPRTAVAAVVHGARPKKRWWEFWK